MNSKFMTDALILAEEAFNAGEVPVGAVITKKGQIIGKGRNGREMKQNSLSHAEIEAINDACKNSGDWRLDGCTMYVTLEPCLMCMGAIVNARIDTLVFGAFDFENGCADSIMNPNILLKTDKPQIFGGIYEDECKKLLDSFFKSVRKNDGKKTTNN